MAKVIDYFRAIFLPPRADEIDADGYYKPEPVYHSTYTVEKNPLNSFTGKRMGDWLNRSK